jgi:hypothetical protein
MDKNLKERNRALLYILVGLSLLLYVVAFIRIKGGV